MTVLIVEDDDLKRQGLVNFVHERLPHASVAERSSFKSGLLQALDDKPDLVLLDMSIPTFDHSVAPGGGRVRPFGGFDFLYELARRAVQTRVIVVTQFDSFGSGAESQTLDEVSARLRAEFPTIFVDTVFYQASESGWKVALDHLLQSIGS